jgi:hypothetical protein
MNLTERINKAKTASISLTDRFEALVEKSNDCHNPSGPGGGQFCSSGSVGPSGGSINMDSIKSKLKGIDPGDLTHAEAQILRATTPKEVKSILHGIDSKDLTHAEAQILQMVNSARNPARKPSSTASPRKIKPGYPQGLSPAQAEALYGLPDEYKR